MGAIWRVPALLATRSCIPSQTYKERVARARAGTAEHRGRRGRRTCTLQVRSVSCPCNILPRCNQMQLDAPPLCPCQRYSLSNIFGLCQAKTSDANAEKQRKAKARLKEGKSGNAFFKFRDEAFARGVFDIKQITMFADAAARHYAEVPPGAPCRLTPRCCEHQLPAPSPVIRRVVRAAPT